jgi:hypothetical protein
MTKHSLSIIAVGAAVSLLGAATPAAAGGCCEMYVVNQGPVFSGPGPFVRQVRDPAPSPCCDSYPYVGFVYSGYPYGYYDAWVGAPHVGPMYPRVMRRYVDQRVYYRVKRPVYQRARIIQISK